MSSFFTLVSIISFAMIILIIACGFAVWLFREKLIVAFIAVVIMACGVCVSLYVMTEKIDSRIGNDTYLYRVKCGIEGDSKWSNARDEFYQLPYDTQMTRLKDMEFINNEYAQFGLNHNYRIKGESPDLLGSYVDLLIKLKGLPIALPLLVFALIVVGVKLAEHGFQSKLVLTKKELHAAAAEREQQIKQFNQLKQQEQQQLDSLQSEQKQAQQEIECLKVEMTDLKKIKENLMENESKAVELASQIKQLNSDKQRLILQKEQLECEFNSWKSDVDSLIQKRKTLIAEEEQYNKKITDVKENYEKIKAELANVQEEVKAKNQKANSNVDWSQYM